MARTFDANTNTQINRQGNYPIELLKIEVGNDNDGNNQDLFLNTGYKDVIFSGDTYSRASGVLGFSAVEETSDTKTNSITIQLTGIPSSTMNIITQLEANGVKSIGATVTIYQAFWDEDRGTVINNLDGDPAVYQKWKGILYSFATTDEYQLNGNIKISLECKSILTAILDTKSGRFTSDMSFKQFNSTDRSMEFVPSIISFNPNFGSEE